MLVLAGPQGLSAPRLSSPTGRTVIIEWDPPAVPNGVILKYQIQRRLMSGGNPSVISEVNATLWRRYVDNTVQPLTAYQYRLIAFNSGPGDPSPYIQTRCYTECFVTTIFSPTQRCNIAVILFQLLQHCSKIVGRKSSSIMVICNIALKAWLPLQLVQLTVKIRELKQSRR